MKLFNFLRPIFFILFVSCGAEIDILGADAGDEPPKKESAECIMREVKGKNICVIQKEETFQIKGIKNKVVDFLFVLDVSDSMLDDLARLGQAFEPLMSQVSTSDWQMFFTTADHGDYYMKNPQTNEIEMHVSSHQSWQDYQGDQPYFGQFMDLEYNGEKLAQKVLNANTPNYVNVFKDTLTRGSSEGCFLAPYCQGPLEQPLRSLNSSLERFAQAGAGGVEASAPPSLRSSADTFISFIVTDEDERVEDQAHATTAQEVAENFKKLFPQKSFHSFALLIQDETCLINQKKHSPSSVYGKKVAELAGLTHGKNISICEENYGPPLRVISSLLRSLIESVRLAKRPVLPESVEVEFVKGNNQGKWTLKGKKLIFENPLETDSEIKVSYFVKAKNSPSKEKP